MSVGLALRYVNLKTIFLTKTALNVFAVKKKLIHMLFGYHMKLKKMIHRGKFSFVIILDTFSERLYVI